VFENKILLRRSIQESLVSPPPIATDLRSRTFCSDGQMLLCGEPAYGHIGAVVIAGPHPLGRALGSVRILNNFGRG